MQIAVHEAAIFGGMVHKSVHDSVEVETIGLASQGPRLEPQSFVNSTSFTLFAIIITLLPLPRHPLALATHRLHLFLPFSFSHARAIP